MLASKGLRGVSDKPEEGQAPQEVSAGRRGGESRRDPGEASFLLNRGSTSRSSPWQMGIVCAGSLELSPAAWL